MNGISLLLAPGRSHNGGGLPQKEMGVDGVGMADSREHLFKVCITIKKIRALCEGRQAAGPRKGVRDTDARMER